MGSTHAPVVAVVPARGGSKRIPRKNVRAFRGVPLLSRTVATLIESELFDDVVVSTDDDEIAALGVEAGASAPFRRPAELSDDHTGARPVIMHAIETLEGIWQTTLGPVCIVYPTAVFMLPSDLSEGREALDAADAEFVFSAVAYDAPIQRALRRRDDGTCEMVWPAHTTDRTQDLDEAYHDAGQFYWGRRDSWMAGRPVFASRSVLHVMPRWRVQDIDSPEDWQRAELLHRMLGHD